MSPTVLYDMIKWSSLTSRIYEFYCCSKENFKFSSRVGEKEYMVAGELEN